MKARTVQRYLPERFKIRGPPMEREATLVRRRSVDLDPLESISDPERGLTSVFNHVIGKRGVLGPVTQKGHHPYNLPKSLSL